ncbi:MAG: rRNA adenine N-6-methyltransferase family protein, partial [Ktedonobacteraceae bacterium]
GVRHMITLPDSATSRAQFVTMLQETGAVHSSAVAHAFSTVPRELFVSLFYQHESRTWVPYSKETHGEQWLPLIYRDEALVTAFDSQNIPTSSSSMPSIMATMLEALHVQPGMDILEIGTGTGYNAALLATLTGNPALVTTIEIDEELAQQAEQILYACVGPVQVIRGDGGTDIQPPRQYQRMIATASAPGIPRAWYAQPAPGGRLVMPLQGSLNASGLLVIEKMLDETNHASGSFFPIPLSFMPMRSLSSANEPSTRELFQMPAQERLSVTEAERSIIEALKEQDFRWFLEWSWPSEGTLYLTRMTLRDGRQAMVLKDPCQRAILQLTQEPNGCWFGHQCGTYALWQHMRRSYEAYEELGRPRKETFHVRIDGEQACLSVRSGETQIPLQDIFL